VQFKDVRLKELGKQAGLLQKLNGKWVPTEAVMNGEPVSREQLDTILLTIDGDKYTSRMGERTQKGTLSLDESKTPAAMDIKRTRSSGETQEIPAICELKGDTLRVCYALGTAARPAEFKSETDSGTLFVVYKRE
jgi:uncharacterized protein (TIGR03067 family)